MAAVKVLGVPGKKLSHDGGYALPPAFEKQMDVVIHENPGVDRTVALNYLAAEAIQKFPFILVILEDGGFIDSPYHDVVQGSGYV